MASYSSGKSKGSISAISQHPSSSTKSVFSFVLPTLFNSLEVIHSSSNFAYFTRIELQHNIAQLDHPFPSRITGIDVEDGVIFLALNLITATTAFWITQSIPVTQIIFNTNEFARFPLTIHPRAIGIV